MSAVAGITLATACGSDSTTAVSGAGAGAAVSSTGTGLFDSSQVHTISIEYDEADYRAMLETFA
ncbi:MAG TPA: hypothetical protein VN257_05955, partial [Actinotalea sp.]|nr:hypothetical protein [Actinotalea sp.]